MKKIMFAAAMLLSVCTFSQKTTAVVTPIKPMRVEPLRDLYILRDTTVNDTIDLYTGTIVHFGSQGFIRGKGLLRGGTIDGALRQQLFDTSFRLENISVYGEVFSPMWVGVNEYSLDNSIPLQKSVDICIANRLEWSLSYGNFKYSKGFKIQYVYNNAYHGACIRMRGMSTPWSERTILTYTGTEGFAIGVQVGKGVEISNLTVYGNYKPLIASDSEYCNMSYEKFGIRDGYNGLVIDFDGSKGSSGSTNVYVHDMSIVGFDICYSISPNKVTNNADILLFERIRAGNTRLAFANGQAQEKGNIIRGLYGWGLIHTLFSSGKNGKAQAGNYLIDGGNIAGKCIRLFDIWQAGWYSTTINNLYSESILSIGNLQSGNSASVLPLTFTGCHFQIMPPGRCNVLASNTTRVKFKNCVIRNYGNYKDSLNMTGWAEFTDCTIDGGMKSSSSGGAVIK